MNKKNSKNEMEHELRAKFTNLKNVFNMWFALIVFDLDNVLVQNYAQMLII
jgi:hypothetical protein